MRAVSFVFSGSYFTFICLFVKKFTYLVIGWKQFRSLNNSYYLIYLFSCGDKEFRNFSTKKDKFGGV